MKIARVFIAAYPGRQVGDLFDVFDADQHPGELLSGVIKEVSVEDDFDPSLMIAVVAEDGSVSFDVSAEKAAAKAVAEKISAITALYDRLQVDVLRRMVETFGTTKPESAQAYYETWKLMVEKPELFRGLKADVMTDLFKEGDALDSREKVSTYARQRIALAEAYSVYRMERIEQFREEKASLD